MPAAFDYRAITSGRKSVENGDFAVVPVIVLKHRKTGTMFVKEEEVIVQISLQVLEGGAEVPSFTLDERDHFAAGQRNALRSLDILTRPRLDTLVAGLLAPAIPLADRLATAINCRKLVSTLSWKMVIWLFPSAAIRVCGQMQWVFWMIRQNRYSFSPLRGSSPAEPCWHRLILLCRRHLSRPDD